MKKMLLIFFACALAALLNAQTIDLSRVSIAAMDSSLLVTNSDSSYIFNAQVLTQMLDGISSVTLVCRTYTGSQWVPVKDTVYTWSNIITNAFANNNAYAVCKPTDNIISICLGRLYYSSRHRYTFRLTGTNGLFTKEFIF